MTQPTVVLLHGVGLDHSMWARVAPLLTDRFSVLTPDLLGHGGRPPVTHGVTLAEVAADVAAQIPAASHVVGFSLGALVAQHLARHRPDLVTTLTSVSSVCQRTFDERQAVLDRLRTATTDFRASAEASLHRWFDGSDIEQIWIRRTSEKLLANDVPSFLNCYRVFADADAEMGPQLPAISAPALAVTGELDPGSTPEMSHRLAAALPDCRVVIVPGARHLLPLERPAELVDCLTTFIGEYAHV